MPSIDPSKIERVAIVGNHTPRQCGIATFTSDLADAVCKAGVDVQVVAIDDREERYEYPPIVTRCVTQDDPESYRDAAEYLNSQYPDVVCVQHEFGIFGGSAGEHLLIMLREINAPIVTTLHTILNTPNAEQMRVMVELARLSERLIVMSRRGRKILEDVYKVPPSSIEVVEHGIPAVERPNAVKPRALGLDTEEMILTFGLIGPAKGLQYVVEALPAIVENHPNVLYVIAGATHPKILSQHGESYRNGLMQRAHELGVGKNLKFLNRFLSLEDLTNLLHAATIYVTPYLNREQITSGTLAYAYGCGNAVVSTPYWHAEELLADDRGILVPFADSHAIAEEINALLDDRNRLAAIQRRAFEIGRNMQWPSVGRDYVRVFAEARQSSRRILPDIACADGAVPNMSSAGKGLQLMSTSLPKVNLSHFLAMTDDVGIFQHATYCIPNRREGYCTDDNARAAIVAVQLQHAKASDLALNLQVKYLSFLDHAFNDATGRMRNFMSPDGRWLEEAGSEDSHGRALWALGVLAADSGLSGVRNLASELFGRALPALEGFTSLRTWCSALLGLSRVVNAGIEELPNATVSYVAMVERLAERVQQCFDNSASIEWPWYEDRLTYDNARIPEAMLLSGQMLGNEKMTSSAVTALEWLSAVQTDEAGYFAPIGSDGFFVRGQDRAWFDQQPLEAAATIDACRDAYSLTGDPAWLETVWRAFAWYLGENAGQRPLCDSLRGGCYDGLHAEGVNENQGAESTLAYLSSLLTVRSLRESKNAVRAGVFLG